MTIQAWKLSLLCSVALLIKCKLMPVITTSKITNQTMLKSSESVMLSQLDAGTDFFTLETIPPFLFAKLSHLSLLELP